MLSLSVGRRSVAPRIIRLEQRSGRDANSIISSVVLTPIFQEGEKRSSLEHPSGTKSVTILSFEKYAPLPE